MYNIIGKKYIFLSISAVLVIASLTSIARFGFKEGIDFKGGTAWQVRIANMPTIETVKDALTKEFKLTEITVVEEPTTHSIILRLPELSLGLHGEYKKTLEKQFGAVEELNYETIGPAIGSELRRKALYAFGGVLITISLYIAFAFRTVSLPVSSWKYGFITLLTLFHDALIPLGLVSYLGARQGIEINTNTIVALLVVMGFSVHDTIVVFDRIRENIKNQKTSSFNFPALVNASVNETIIRSVNTSLTLILILCALLLFGSANIFYFVLVILVGVVVGTYSSIFIASPLITLWNRSPSGRG